ncbi:exopolysaccharide biosynthesis GT4 family glycosyltransferase EpsE [Nioella nitratireducens]|uniref:exopolysaccharide biosynthesis GT4 family glycosyltransferase EpsE n=1 Tax=Nioella nitratireducens TaxID=1287720 RepID=UPI0008FD6B0C|nr:exopolysaccharide biosynthesis GT4 family glycosyltransferase EpsE [Nioella nitratireducens]
MTRKLGYLVPQFPGQTHIFFWREIAELEKRGVTVDLLSTRRPPPGLVAHDWSAAAMARTTYLGRPDIGTALSALPRLPYGELLREVRTEGKALARDVAVSVPAAQALIRQCRRRGIEHVHVHSCGRAALLAAMARRMGGPRYSLTLHGPLSDYGPGQRFKWRHAAFASIITEKLRAEMQADLPDDLPKRLFIQPMGVDTDVLAPIGPYRPATKAETLRLFSCGRLNVVKGHQDLMQAVRTLLDQGRDVELAIAGEDDDGGSGYHTGLEARIAELGLTGKVRLLGAIDASAVRDHIRAAHLFVLASWHEPLGVALMEAMSCGTPTIGTNAGGVAELIRDGVDGVLVPPKSPGSLAAAIAALADDPARAARLSVAGRTRIVEGFHAGRGADMLISAIWGQQ